MRQLNMFDPREALSASEAMLADDGLRRAIKAMRADSGDSNSSWPYVERLCDVDGRPAWAVDDGGRRFVVVNVVVYRLSDLGFAEASIREAARAAFDRLDAGVSS